MSTSRAFNLSICACSDDEVCLTDSWVVTPPRLPQVSTVRAHRHSRISAFQTARSSSLRTPSVPYVSLSASSQNNSQTESLPPTSGSRPRPRRPYPRPHWSVWRCRQLATGQVRSRPLQGCSAWWPVPSPHTPWQRPVSRHGYHLRPNGAPRGPRREHPLARSD